MRKVGIIGLGHVGATVAYTLFTHGTVDELVLLDQKEAKVTAEYNDLRDALARNHYHVTIKMQDYAELKDADLLVTAFGKIEATAETGDRFAEFPINQKNALEVGRKIKESGFHGILLNISNPCDAITTILQKTTQLPKNHVFGTGTFLDTSRMQRIVGEKENQDPRNVSGYVLGEHGASQFIAWSTVRIDQRSDTQLFSKEEEQQLNHRPNENSMKVALGKGYTSYAIATCAYRLIEAVFSDARLFAPVSVYLPKLETYIGYPAIVGKDGIEEVIELSLNEMENQELTRSAAYIKQHVDQLDSEKTGHKK